MQEDSRPAFAAMQSDPSVILPEATNNQADLEILPAVAPALSRTNSGLRSVKLEDVITTRQSAASSATGKPARGRGRPPKRRKKSGSSAKEASADMSPNRDDEEEESPAVPSADEDWQPPGGSAAPVASGSGSHGKAAAQTVHARPDASSGWMQDATNANQTVSNRI